MQEELSKIKESDQNLLKFQEEAINAESRRNHHMDISEKSGLLGATADLSISKYDFNNARGRNNRRGGRRGGPGTGAVGRPPTFPAKDGHVTHTLPPPPFPANDSSHVTQAFPPVQQQVVARGRGGYNRQERNHIICYKCKNKFK